ncbi:MAG TPA: hypothetical protein VJX67_14925 [Blastocatellia bacterium]|nr:hypothetical protein [Blastocatellia bacterium]
MADGRYRIARASDFAYPGWVMSKDANYGNYLRNFMESPLETSNATPGSGNPLNFAAIVVDKTVSGRERFCLALFYGPISRAGHCRVYWLFRNKDLSRSQIETWSAGLAFTEFGEKEGSQSACFINWDRAHHRFSCDRKYKSESPILT